MITIGKHRMRSFLTMEYTFSGIRIIDRELTPVRWNLTVNLVPSQKKRKNLAEISRKAELTYQRIYYWLESSLNNVITVSTDNTLGMAVAATSTNVIMMCPDEPYDEVIVELLHSKFTALADGNVVVGEVSIKADDSTAGYSYDCPDGQYDLPLTVKEYISVSSKYKKPWWYRNDGFCYEFLKPEESKSIPDEEFFENIIDPMKEFDEAASMITEMGAEVSQEQATIIQVEKWKPRKV